MIENEIRSLTEEIAQASREGREQHHRTIRAVEILRARAEVAEPETAIALLRAAQDILKERVG